MTTKKTSNKRTVLLATGAIAVIVGLYLLKIMFAGNVYSKNGEEDIYFAIPSTVTTVSEISESLDSSLDVSSMLGFRFGGKNREFARSYLPWFVSFEKWNVEQRRGAFVPLWSSRSD